MEIKSLSKEVIAKIRSASNINNLTQCVTELVLNSLDAKASAIAVRLNSVSCRIQVIDNGFGISQENLEKIAQKYCTNKCESLADLEKKPNTYGYKGESLWSISNICKILNITSKHSKSEKTFSKNISARKHGNVTLAKKRQSNGTTITIDGFFHNLPVRQKRIRREFEFEEIENFLKKISIIHPQVSITLRDDITGRLLFKRAKSENIIRSLTNIYPDVKYDETVVMKVHKDKITVEALLSKDVFKDKVIQHLYVNKRPVYHQKLQTFICKELTKDKNKKLQSVNNALSPMFIFNIKCSIPNFSVIYENSEAKVEFLNIHLIYRCVEKLILNFLGKSKPMKRDTENHENRKSVCGVSDLAGTVKGFGFKDWLKTDEMTKRASEIIEDVVEHNETEKDVALPTKTPKKCTVKKNKLKSLPIKIYEQYNDEQKKVIVSENNTNNSEINGKKQENEGFIVPAIPCENSVEKIMMENFRKLEKNCREVTSKQKHDETLFSHFTNTEEKGKDLLMYMFLKSTELFNEDASQEAPTQIPGESPNERLDSSRETIMESNIFFENVTRTKTHQLNKTISVSVRLKRRKNFEEKSNFPEISFYTPHKKRKIEYVRGAGDLVGKKRSMSPYFEGKGVDNCYTPKKKYVDKQIQACLFGNFEEKSSKHISNINIWNSLINNDNINRDIFYTKQLSNKNMENSYFSSCFVGNNNNIRKCFDQISIFNENKLLHNYNQSYIFNFQSAIIENAGFKNNHRLNEILPTDNNDPFKKLSNGKIHDFKNNSCLESFDFGNLPVSPIPKIQKFSADKINEGITGIFDPVIPVSTKNVKKLGKYVSEGEFLKGYSPYFVKKKLKCKRRNYDNFSFSLTNINLPQNKTKGSIMGKFKRYHTEPLDNSRLQYIQNVKKNIDKIFIDWKCDQVPHRNINEVKLTSTTKKKETEVFTIDSLEHDKDEQKLQHEKDKDNNIIPLWKKFIGNKQTCIKIKTHDHPRKNSFNDENNYNEVLQKKRDYFERKICSAFENNVGESPDLFSNVKLQSNNEKTWQHLSFRSNSAVSFDLDEVFNDNNVDREKDLTTLTAVGTAPSSNLIISINGDEENACKIDAGPNIDVAVRNASSAGNEWIQKIDQEGKEFYFNRKTGLTSFLYPKQEEIYHFKQRPEFMPKGLSPLLVPDQKLEKSLSPFAKEKLQGEILKSYEEDLGLIKWKKCIKGYDPKKFFENLYNEKANEYEKDVLNVIKTGLPKFASTSSSGYKFNKIILNDLRVIGQIDQKFIASIGKKNFDLILLDQHAVHERIRLEDLLKDYQGKSSICENVTLFMNHLDVQLLIKHKKYLNDIGIHFRNLKNGITVYGVPSCLLNKVTKESPLPKLLQHFIRQLLELTRDTRGVLTGLPRMLNEIINMEACRGSVKFGELLERKEMEELIAKLSHCILPFQCAHGRPTLIPLLALNEITKETVVKPNLWRLRGR